MNGPNDMLTSISIKTGATSELKYAENNESIWDDI
jgi:hypothetical protein